MFSACPYWHYTIRATPCVFLVSVTFLLFLIGLQYHHTHTHILGIPHKVSPCHIFLDSGLKVTCPSITHSLCPFHPSVHPSDVTLSALRPKPLHCPMILPVAKKALLTLTPDKHAHTNTHNKKHRDSHSPCSGSGPQYLSGASLIILISSLGTVGRHDTLPDHHHRHMNTHAQP